MNRQFMPRLVQCWVILPAVLLLAVLSAPFELLAADPPGADRLRELGAILADSGQSGADRSAAAAEARRLRPELIAAAGPGSLDAPRWALDQAAAELAALGSDGADLAVLFGLPTERQRAAVLQGATEALRFVGEAESRIERLLADAKAEGGEGGAGGGLNEARASVLRRLRDDEAGLRAPYYRGRAALLLAAISRESGDAEATRVHASAAIEAVSMTEAIDPIAETSRRVTGAIAALFAGEREAARDVLERIIRPGGAAPGPDEIDASTHAEALFALAAARAADGAEGAADGLLARLDDPPFRHPGAGGDAAQSDPLLIVFAHDTAARLLLEATEPNRERAVGITMRLLDRDDLELSLDQRRMLVGARLDRLLAGGRDVSAYSPRVVALRALHAARDPARRVEAIAFLRQAAGRTDDSALRELARFEAAALLLDAEADDAERTGGVELLTSMLQEYAEWPRAAEAAAVATAHARALVAADPESAERRALLERALRSAIGALPGSEADPWRLDLARLLVTAERLSPVDPRWRPEDDRFSEALTLLEQVAPDSETAAPARELALALHLRAIESAREVDPRLAEAAARRALRWASDHRSALEGRFRLELAEILIEQQLGPEAKAQLLAITDGGASLPGGRPRVRLNLARARLLAGAEAEAFGDLLDLAGDLDAPPPPPAGSTDASARPEAFWEAWTLILEILQRQNEDGRRTQAILAHIMRLRSIDADLGAEPWRTRINNVETRPAGPPPREAPEGG